MKMWVLMLWLCAFTLSGCSNLSENMDQDSQFVSGNPDIKVESSTSPLPKTPNLVISPASNLVSPVKVKDPLTEFYANVPSCDMGSFTLRDLMVDEVRISNSHLPSIASTLSLMGYGVIDQQGMMMEPAGIYSCSDLPLVVIPPRAQELSLSLTNELGSQYSGEKQITPLGYSDASELDRFLVYFHPSQINQYNKLKWLVAEKLDVASSQVYIETMVLEVREEDSEEFGIEYSKADGDKFFTLGGLVPGGDTIDFIRDTITDPDTGLQIYAPGYGKRLKLKALIDEGKAEILSRPSVLAISNRQALIQIVDVIQSPLLSSTLSQTGGLQVSAYSFEPLLIGITLNLKPRVSADRQWLTLEIDATVDSEDDENSGQVFATADNGDQVLLAEKQGASSKKVRTFARIPDRTPIIIGGLVSSTKEKREGKFPVLNRLPLVGKLFTSRDDEETKREIIIVLTPYILSEDSTSVVTNQPTEEILNKNSKSLLLDRQQLVP